MNEKDTIILSILASTDALWSPCRKPAWGGPGVVIWERRQLYRDGGGVPWNSRKLGAKDAATFEAERKAIYKTIAEARVAELVETSNPTGLRTVTVKLTEAGDDHARKLTGQTTRAEAMTTLDRIHAFRTDPAGVDNAGLAWMPETSLAGVEWGGADSIEPLSLVQFAMLPLLVSGLAESVCSIQGHCWYALTPAGVAIAQEREQKPPTAPKPREFGAGGDDEAWNYYVDRLKDERAGLAMTAPSKVGEIGLMPFPVCPIRRGDTR
jgi:hypothetical protein